MKRYDAEAKEVELFIGAGRPLLAFGVVCVKSLPAVIALGGLALAIARHPGTISEMMNAMASIVPGL